MVYSLAMRKIGIRKFHQNMWEEIKNLPVMVTSRGVNIFKVEDSGVVATMKAAETPIVGDPPEEMGALEKERLEMFK